MFWGARVDASDESTLGTYRDRPPNRIDLKRTRSYEEIQCKSIENRVLLGGQVQELLAYCERHLPDPASRTAAGGERACRAYCARRDESRNTALDLANAGQHADCAQLLERFTDAQHTAVAQAQAKPAQDRCDEKDGARDRDDHDHDRKADSK